MNLAREREGKPETEEPRGNVTEKIILERTEMFDQTDSVIHFYMINSHLCLVSFFFFFLHVFQGWAEFTGGKSQEENVQSQL